MKRFLCIRFIRN